MSTSSPILMSVQVGLPQSYNFESRSDRVDRWQSAIVKTEVEGPVAVGPTGLAGDGQADTVHHGGIDKAVLAYAAAHYDLWNAELPDKAWYQGGFGENLTIKGLDETTVCLADVYRIGDVLLEVSQPRQPCWKPGQLWGQPDLIKRIVKTGRTGWYLRVRQPGTLAAGQTVELLERPHPDWTIARAHQLMYGLVKDRAAAEKLSRLPQVSLVWREELIDRSLV